MNEGMIRKAVLGCIAVLAFCGAALGGTALKFDGVDDYVPLSYNAVTTTEFTISAWANQYGQGGGYYKVSSIFYQRDYDIGDNHCSIGLVTENMEDGPACAGIRSSDGAVQKLGYTRQPYGEWHHYAMTVDSEDFIFYVDGAEVNSVSNLQNGDYVTGIDCVDIGRYRYITYFVLRDTGFFNGAIDEVRIYDRALSPEDIQDSMYIPLEGNEPNLIGYWNFDEGAGQVAYDSSSSGNDGQLGSTAGIDDSDPVWVESGLPEYSGVTYHIDGTNGSDSSDGLSYETAFATIQYGIDTAQDGDTILVWPGVYNESVFFINKGVTVRSAADAAVIEAFDIYAVSFYTAEGPNSILQNFVIRNSDTGILVSSGSPRLEYLTIVDCNVGIDAGFGADPNIRNCILWNNSLGDLVGCSAEYSMVEEELGPVSWWEFSKGNGMTAYDSAGDNDGTLVNGPVWTTGIIDGALEFDGVDDYVEVADNIELEPQQLTVAAWVYRENASTRDTILQKGSTHWDDDRNGYLFRILESASIYPQKARLYIVAGSNTNVMSPVSDTEIEAGIWYHLAATYDGSYIRIYVNGQEEGTPVSETRAIDYSGGYQNFKIGGQETTGDFDYIFDGKIDEVAIYDRALSGAEIEQLYETGLVGMSYLGPLFADANGGDYHLLSERGRYRATTDEWLLDEVSSPGIDGGDPMIEPVNERMPNGGRVNMGAYGNTGSASMSEFAMAGDTNRDGRVDFLDFAILADKWLEALPWAE